MSDERLTMIRQRLEAKLQPESLEVSDQSRQHAGHAGAAGGGGHYDVTVVAKRFDGLNQVQRHRLIYAALGDAMGSQIHALGITALTPDEI